MKCRLLLLMIFVNLSFNLFSLNSSFSRDKVLFVGGNNPPYEYKNEDGEPEGYDIDLVKEIMKRIGSDYEIKLFNWDKALKYAKEDKNAVLLGMIYSKENAAEFSFTTPFEYISLSIISNKNNKYQTFRELKDKSVIVIDGSYEEMLVNNNKEKFNIKPIIINKVQEGAEMIHHDICDAFLVKSSMGIYAIKQRNYDLNICEINDQPPLKYCMASSVDNDSIIMQINHSLSSIKSDGTYNVIYDKWMKTIEKDREIPAWVKYVVLIGSSLLFIAIIFTILLVRRIHKSRLKIKDQNEKMRKMNEQLSLIIKNTNSGYIYLSPNLDVIWESISQNKSFIFNNLYYTTDRKCYSLIDDNELCKKCPVRKSIFTGMIQISENMMGNIPIEQTAIPILDKEGLTAGVILKIEDISQRKKNRDELIKAKEEAEKSDKLKSAFLANVTHEFRTPLNSIMGFSSLLVDEERKEERQKYLDIIQLNTDMLVNLIDSILDMSSLEIGDVTIDNLEFNVNDLFISIKSNLDTTFLLAPGVEFIIESSLDILMVDLDFRRAEQILLNFLTNASKYTSSGSITLGYEITDNEIKFYVKDTGCGIPKDKIKLLFTSFQKLNSYKQGIGLGLSIAKIVAKAMGGKVEVDSELNVGSTFWLIFPKSVISDLNDK